MTNELFISTFPNKDDGSGEVLHRFSMEQHRYLCDGAIKQRGAGNKEMI